MDSKILSPQEKIEIFKNLFKGRDDVFAVYWEKADKSASGYAPICLNEWKPGICNKLQRKKCRDCENQRYAILDENYLDQHLRGQKIYGIYPLMNGNVSSFLAADFDGKNWEKQVLSFLEKCKLHEIPAYLERSRSGSGGHIWIFFTESYPAHKSRNIAINILREAKIIDQFEKEDSFDRLFPNQDILSGKGFGNLIALPLQGKTRQENNTVFLDPENNLAPYPDQWEFLQNIQKITKEKLDEIYDKFNQHQEKSSYSPKSNLAITIKNQIYLQKNRIPKSVINFLRDELNFANSEYIVKKKMGLSIYGIEKYFKLAQSDNENVIIPRGFLDELISFLNENGIKFEISDNRIKLESANFTSSLKLFDYQREAIENILESENGILVAPPGSGKTMIGLELIARLQQPALIITHKKQIFDQWLERIEHFLNIPKREIGQFKSGKKEPAKIAVGMIQTLNRMNIEEISDKFGVIIVDECHHMPAKLFRNVITKFNPFYLYGLTATPERKNNDTKLIYVYLGKTLHTIEKNFQKQNSNFDAPSRQKIIIRNSDLSIPFKIKTDNFQILSKIISFDSSRNDQIANDIKNETSKNLKCLVLTERKEHVGILSCYLKREFEIITLTGDLTENQKKEKIKQIKSGDFQIIIATGQLIGEGTDFPGLDCLFLVYPFSFSGKLTQYIGRVQRNPHKDSIIYDYRDPQIEFLEKLFKKRIGYYKKHFGMENIEQQD